MKITIPKRKHDRNGNGSQSIVFADENNSKLLEILTLLRKSPYISIEDYHAVCKAEKELLGLKTRKD